MSGVCNGLAYMAKGYRDIGESLGVLEETDGTTLARDWRVLDNNYPFMLSLDEECAGKREVIEEYLSEIGFDGEKVAGELDEPANSQELLVRGLRHLEQGCLEVKAAKGTLSDEIEVVWDGDLTLYSAEVAVYRAYVESQLEK